MMKKVINVLAIIGMFCLFGIFNLAVSGGDTSDFWDYWPDIPEDPVVLDYDGNVGIPGWSIPLEVQGGVQVCKLVDIWREVLGDMNFHIYTDRGVMSKVLSARYGVEFGENWYLYGPDVFSLSHLYRRPSLHGEAYADTDMWVLACYEDGKLLVDQSLTMKEILRIMKFSDYRIEWK